MGEAGELISIRAHQDIVEARLTARRIAEQIGFPAADLVAITTAVSEMARNIVEHAKGGEILLKAAQDGDRRGLVVIARDSGPGIPAFQPAMYDGDSAPSGPGMGLPGARLLMDEFAIESSLDRGTTVTMTKWLRQGKA